MIGLILIIAFGLPLTVGAQFSVVLSVNSVVGELRGDAIDWNDDWLIRPGGDIRFNNKLGKINLFGDITYNRVTLKQGLSEARFSNVFVRSGISRAISLPLVTVEVGPMISYSLNTRLRYIYKQTGQPDRTFIHKNSNEARNIFSSGLHVRISREVTTKTYIFIVHERIFRDWLEKSYGAYSIRGRSIATGLQFYFAP